MGKLFHELQQRKVFRVAAIYIVVAWLIIQVADTISPLLNLPLSTPQLVLFVLIVLFPVSLILAWFFEITHAGIKIQTGDEAAPEKRLSNRQTVVYALVGLLGVVATFFIVNPFVVSENLQPGFSQQQVASTESSTAEELIGPPSENSIAVLPFADMSVNTDQEYMSDGIAEEMLNLLAKIPALRVTARTSAFSFKGKDSTISEIGKQLNVAHVLEGSVRTAGNQIRITAQLIEVSTDTHLWSETYTRELVDIFAIQDEIAAEVVRNLELRLSGDIHVEREISFEAYSLYLQAKYLLNQGTYESTLQAAALYEEVLSIVPDYAPALTALKFVFSSEAMIAESDIDDQIEWVDKALASDPDYAPAYAALGELELVQGNLIDAARHISRALTLDASNEDVLIAASLMVDALGRSSVEINEYILRRDPVNPYSHLSLGFAKLIDGSYEDAITHARAALVLSPDMTAAHYLISAAYSLKEDFTAALEEIEQEPLGPYRTLMSVMIYHALGEHAASDEFLRELIENYADSIPYVVAVATASRGEIDLAFEYLQKSIEVSSPGLWGARTDPTLTALHADPRWPAFLDKAGMAPEIIDAIEFDVSLPE